MDDRDRDVSSSGMEQLEQLEQQEGAMTKAEGRKGW